MEKFTETERDILTSIDMEKYCSSTPTVLVPKVLTASPKAPKRKKDSSAYSDDENQDQNEAKKRSAMQHLDLDTPVSKQDVSLGNDDDLSTLIATPTLPPQIIHNIPNPPQSPEKAQTLHSSNIQSSTSAASKWRGLRQRKTLPQPVRTMLAPSGIKYNERKTYYLYRHSQVDKTDTNILIFLHAENDRHGKLPLT